MNNMLKQSKDIVCTDSVRKEKRKHVKDGDHAPYDMFAEHSDDDFDVIFGDSWMQKDHKNAKSGESVREGSCENRASGFDWAGFGFKSSGLSKEDDGFSKGGRGVKRRCVREEGKYGSGLELLGGGRKGVDDREGSFGGFEKHTKGIGMKLLEKMGYKGGGLGKNEQGIVDPVEAKVRPKAMGMGYKNYKEVSLPKLKEFEESKLFHDVMQCSEKRTEGKLLSKRARFEMMKKKKIEERTERKLWLNKARFEKKKRNYVSMEELQAGKEDWTLKRKVIEEVIDMRGPEVRVWKDLENLNTDETLKQKKLNEEIAYQQKQLDDLKEIVGVLDCLDTESMSGTLTLTSLANKFGDLQTRFAGHYKLRSLPGIVCSFAIPLFKRYFQGWNPLQDPTYGLEVVSLWKNLLQEDISDGVSPYTRIFLEVVLPAIRIAGTNTWQTREPGPMIRLLESWEDLLPISVCQTILDNIVMPKLLAAVDSWEPRKETIPIHLWVHPWLPWLHQKSDIICQTICARFGMALQAWQPNDMSAYHILEPWKSAFDPTSWKRLILRYIKPKLLTILEEFQLNPANKNELECVLTWATAIPINHMLHLMDVFFDKWQAVLYHWLCEGPDVEELISWFLYWKNLIPPQLLANDYIQNRLKVGLNMMDKFSEGRKVVPPAMGEKVRYCRVNKQMQYEAQKNGKLAHEEAFDRFCRKTEIEDRDGRNEMSLKQIIELEALQNGLIFKPKPGRTQDGHQIYGFGNISLIIDSGKERVSAQIEGKWCLLSSFSQLLEWHNGCGRKQH
ncbi:Septin and tuftelin-interacting protein [Heracleum sosnowskyi]|uniref:Septin and tuftelin-interacting protein n=1 Tax=Heracleum sosnowskyi TaxID=360622 RepID=A0AAD8N0I1_9APIA|nr:Septin and tuftelin-interacting protein [Heracleum sosnowskyi]